MREPLYPLRQVVVGRAASKSVNFKCIFFYILTVTTVEGYGKGRLYHGEGLNLAVNVKALTLGTKQAYLPCCQEFTGLHVALYDVTALST